MNTKPKHGDLKVWWIPQVPMRPFEVNVESLVEAKLLLDSLAKYDLFQFENKIKLDYANAGGLSMFDETDTSARHPLGQWSDWYSDDAEGIDYYSMEDLKKLDAKVDP